MAAGRRLRGSTLSRAQRRDAALSPTTECFITHLLSLRESKVQIVIEDTWPFRQRAGGQQSGTNPLRMDVTTETGALFRGNPRLKDKALLLDLTIVNPCVSTNLANAARQAGKHLADAVQRKKTQVSGLVPRYLLTPSSCYVNVW